MPLRDQDGNLVSSGEIRTAVNAEVHEMVVRHSEVLFLDADGEVLFHVQRRTHPGAGLEVEFDEKVRV